MIHYKIFVFNSFQVNAYVVWDHTKSCILIDPACYTDQDCQPLFDFIEEEGLKPEAVVNTHCHIDHICGNNVVTEKYDIPLIIHPAGEGFIQMAPGIGVGFGFEIENPKKPDRFIEEGEELHFGDESLHIIYAPGHADGSICLYHPEQKILFTGDVLFRDSVGRADLPTGNMQMLVKNIKEKILTLDEEVRVFPGHGPETDIAYEKANNPYVSIV